MTDQEMQQEFEIRVYPVAAEDDDWVMGVFRKGSQRLVSRPLIYGDRMNAAEAAQILARMSGMEIHECSDCQDLSYPYTRFIMRRLIVRGIVYGSLAFLLYFLAVRFL